MKLASEQMHSLVRQTCTLWVAAFKELKSDLSTISEKCFGSIDKRIYPS